MPETVEIEIRERNNNKKIRHNPLFSSYYYYYYWKIPALVSGTGRSTLR